MFADVDSTVWPAVASVLVVQVAGIVTLWLNQQYEFRKARLARDDAKESAQRDSEAKMVALAKISKSAEEAKRVGAETHVLVNGSMLVQKRTTAALALSAYAALKRLAEITKQSGDMEAVEGAKTASDAAAYDYEAHKIKIANAEAESAKLMEGKP